MSGDLLARLGSALSSARVVDLAARLIRSASPNPPGAGEPIAAVVRERLLELGCRDVETFEPQPGRVSLAARWGTPTGRALVWNGHLDVVPPGEEASWTVPPYAGRVRDGKLWGRGATDMKGSVACALAALETIAAAELELDGEVVLLLGSDEETGGDQGTAHLLRAGAARGAEAAICGEATSLDLFVAAKGLLWIELTVRGRACHASQPERGRNAVAEMAHVLGALERWRSRVSHPLLGEATLAPTTVHGGVKENLIPDVCRLTLDRRLLPGETVADAIAEVERLMDEVRRDRGVDVAVSELAHWAPSEIDPGTRLVRVAQRVVEPLLGRAPAIAGSTGATDARHLINDGRIPTLILGPGSMDQAHTVDEWIAIEQLELATLAFAAVFAEYLGWSARDGERR